MPIKNEIYRCKTQQEAVAWMEQQAGRKMYPCIYPSGMGLDYYISTDGVMYASLYCNKKRQYMTYRLIARKNTFLRHNDWTYQLSSNGIDNNVLIQKLVYCTFALKYWDPSIKIIFKDENSDNCNIDNLTVRNYTITSLTSDHTNTMRHFTPEYKSNFKKLSKFLQYTNGLTKDEADDCTQDAFMRMIVNSSDKMDSGFFIGHWVAVAKKMSMDYVNRKMARVDLDDYITNHGSHDTGYEINLLNIISDENQREIMQLTSEGYSGYQIADITGISYARVYNMKNKAKQILRDYLKTDKEIMKIYAKDTP
jgi:DNA-directed RNA polymerase specialized sigma24 family protein